MSKAIQRTREGDYTLIKGSTRQEDITVINRYAPNTGPAKYIDSIQY